MKYAGRADNRVDGTGDDVDGEDHRSRCNLYIVDVRS